MAPIYADIVPDTARDYPTALHRRTYRALASLWGGLAALYAASAFLLAWRLGPEDPSVLLILLRLLAALALAGTVAAARSSYESLPVRLGAACAGLLLLANVAAFGFARPDALAQQAFFLFAHLLAVGLSLAAFGRPVSVLLVGLWVAHLAAHVVAHQGLVPDFAAEAALSLGVLIVLVVLVEQRSDADRAAHADAERARRQEGALRRLAQIAEQTDSAVLMTDARRCVRWVNRSYERLTGRSFERVRGIPAAELLDCGGADPGIRAEIRAALERERPARVTLRSRSAHGREYWVELDLQPLRDAVGGFVGFCVVQSDVTELIRRQEVERERAAENALLRRLMQTALAGSDVPTFLEHALCQLRDGTEWLQPEDRVRFELAGPAGVMVVDGSGGGGADGPWSFDVPLVHEETFLGRLRIAVRRGVASGTPERRDFLERCAGAVALGIVNRMRLQEARRTAFELEQFLELSIDLLGIASLDGRFVKVSRAWYDVLGYQPGTLEGREFMPMIHPDDLQATADAVQRLNAGERVINFVNRYRRADGTYVLIEWRSTVAEELGLVYFAARDVTERQRLTDELVLSLRRAEEVAALSGVGGWYVETATMTPHWDAVTRAIHEVDDDFEPDFESAVAFYPPEAREAIETAVERSMLTGEGYDLELPFVTAKGNRRWVQAVGRAMLREGSGEVVALVGAFQDITDRKRREQDLEAARSEAEASRDAASRFLANMSHEIRTPMTGVLGLLDIVLDGGLEPEQRGHLLGARQSADSLLSILNDILDFSKIEAEGVTVNREPCELMPLCEQVLAVFRPTAAPRRVELAFECAADVPERIVTDASRLRQVLVNLVGNAVKFTEAGRVTLALAWRSDPGAGPRLRFEVRDTGIGIPEEARRRLFQRFSQADASTTRRFGGTGLGLAISKQVVDALGGTIGCDSVPGEGSTFWLELPGPQAGAAVEALPAEAGTQAPRPARAGADRTCRVLVAEDTPVNQTIVRAFLERDGHRVEVVANGVEALAALEAESYDVVLMDVHMPVMDGVEATRRLRGKEGALAAVPVVALTANVMPGDRERYLQAGMDDFLPKPIDRPALRAMIARYAPEPPLEVAEG